MRWTAVWVACLGGSLVVRGEAGIGKPALLSEAATGRRDMLVLAATGVQSGAILFAGLHQLLRPILTNRSVLPALETRQ